MVYRRVGFCEILKMINEKNITVLLFSMRRHFGTSQRSCGKGRRCSSQPAHQHGHRQQRFGTLARPQHDESSLQIVPHKRHWKPTIMLPHDLNSHIFGAF